MKNRKITLGIIFMLVIIMIIVLPTFTDAANLNSKLYFGINETKNGFGYAIGNPTGAGEGSKIWNIVKYSSGSYSDPTATDNIYCIRAGAGFTNSTSMSRQREYTNYFNMKTEKGQIPDSNVNGLKTRTANVDGASINSYNAVLALADLFYIPGVSDASYREQLLENANDKYDNYKTYDLNNTQIQAIQQAALWFYTNSDDSTHYNMYNNDNWLNYTQNGTTYDSIQNYNPTSEVIAENRVGTKINYQAVVLYNYLVSEAAARVKAGSYNSSTTRVTLYTNLSTNIEQPLIKIERKGQFDLALRKYITKVNGTNVENSRVPNIDKSTIRTTKTATYKHRKDAVEVKTGDIVTYNLTVYNEGDIEGRASKIVDQLPTGLKFSKLNTSGYTYSYNETTNTITFSKTGTNNLPGYDSDSLSSETLEIECVVTATKAGRVYTNVAWISEEIDEDGNVITNRRGDDRDSEPETNPNTNKDNMTDYKGTTTQTDLSQNIYYPGQQDDDDFEKVIISAKFDLALRKYVTKLNGTELADSRIPNIDKSTINTTKTATYKHRKDPVEIKVGDIVTYNLTVYNEGNMAGRAVEITDQLPTGLKFLRVNTPGYTANYNETSNIVTITKTNTNNLPAYNGTTLNSETAEIECEVTGGRPGKAFTNVAWISREIDEDGREATNPGIDIDSSTSEKPNVNKDNIENYKGTTAETDLSKEIYYSGEQDDDDFEKLIIPTNFDLALRKYITKVDGKDVTNTRAPNIDKATIATNKTATYKHRKDPVEVQTGSIITYKLTIYNEGNMAGRASKIEDQLPEGMQFVEMISSNYTANYNSTNNKISFIKKDNNNIAAYNNSNLESETIEFNCIITETKANKVFTNVAWISEEIDDNNLVITTQNKADRDSEPATKPNVNKDNMTDYKGTTTETDLSKSDTYYPGEQDDDDFEKVIIPAKFDLALRKYITKINGTELSNRRIPEIDTSTLETEKTATYKHRKDPVQVQTGDTITYKLTIYNEGNMAGRAAEVIDQLPTGLRFSRINSSAYTAEYEETTNIVKITKVDTANIPAYTKNETLSSDTIEIECIVTATKANKAITNVAWISREIDEDGREATNPGIDIDSSTSEKPEVNKDNMTDYKGTTEESDLSKNIYYPGEQDEDDFEKIIIPRNFDLALRKYITKVDEDEVINSRTPDIDKATISSNRTATYKHRKDPVEVKNGSVITYKITVYNEGNMDGRASKIVDQLPSGIKYKEMVSTNYTASYDEASNKITFTKIEYNNLKAYNSTTLESETLEFKCTVTATRANKVYTNVAWISEEIDEDNLVITNQLEADRDSEPATTPNVNKDNMTEYKGTTTESDLSKNIYYPGEQDDDDFEKVIIPAKFDLALRKYVTKINGKNVETREPQIDTSTISGATTTATYNHRKDPVQVEIGDVVTYNLAIYNEGNIAGRALEITDQLPTGLKFSKINSTIYKVKSYNEENNKLVLERNASNKDNLLAYNGGTILTSEKVEIECIVEPSIVNKSLTNVAWISKQINEDGEEQDIDSQPSVTPNVNKDNTTDYKGTTSETDLSKNIYYPGQQDDDDFEKIIVPAKFDLALRKYITKVDGRDVTNTRTPNIDKTTIATNKTATYKHRKDPVEVKPGSIISYNITVYNEGNIAGRANKIVDQLPTGLKYEKMISTNYTATYNEQSNEITFTKKDTNNLSAFDGKDLKSETIEFTCSVITRDPNNVLTNVAWISEEIDEEGRTATNPGIDIDSSTSEKPNVNKDNMNNYKGTTTETDLSKSDTYYLGEQDDDDFEKVIIPAKFDLALRKYITKVDGKNLENTRNPNVDTSTINDNNTTGTYKHRKDPVIVKRGSIVTYNLTVYNEGNVAGRAIEITDQLPEGLKILRINTQGYIVEYDENTNIAIIKNTKAVDLAPFDGENLSSETIEIECEITGKIANKAYTNVAWISEDSNNDIDSNPDNHPNVNKDNSDDYKGRTTDEDLSNPDKYYDGQEDDDDFEKIIVPADFDLKLIKRVAEVNGEEVENRIKSIDITNLANETKTTADYVLNKQPVSVKKDDLIKYTFRVYNEGNIDGYAAEITDDLPEGLEFITNTANLTDKEKEAVEYNASMNWKMFKGEDEKLYIKTDYLAKGKGQDLVKEESNLIKAFDKFSDYSDSENSRNPDYREVSVILKITADGTKGELIRNEAAITKNSDEDGEEIEDRDSDIEEWKKYEDDEDYDNIVVQRFDLSLRKFITSINQSEINSRIPRAIYNKESNKISYEHPKNPLEVLSGDMIIYTIRVYNEGTVDGYAKEVMDDIPDGLELLEDNLVNKQYRWKYNKENNSITTDYLSKEQEKEVGENLLKAFDSSKEISETNPSYRDLKVAFKVVEPNGSDKILVNSAQISDDCDKDGNPIEDIDSHPGEWIEGEDDQDKEYVKLTCFDLVLRKWVTESIVIENGKETVTKTGNTAEMDPETPAKVELHRNKLNQVIVKFRYSIRVTNEGDIEGYAKEITDYIPEGLRFVAEDNPGWKYEGNNEISTRLLEDRLLKPGESAEVSVLLTWINGKDNIGLKTNTAEISEDYNDKNVPDRDSTPNNKKPGEDDIDDAPVILAISTGQERIYYVLGFTVLLTIAGGIVLIKKYVL